MARGWSGTAPPEGVARGARVIQRLLQVSLGKAHVEEPGRGDLDLRQRAASRRCLPGARSRWPPRWPSAGVAGAAPASARGCWRDHRVPDRSCGYLHAGTSASAAAPGAGRIPSGPRQPRPPPRSGGRRRGRSSAGVADGAAADGSGMAGIAYASGACDACPGGTVAVHRPRPHRGARPARPGSGPRALAPGASAAMTPHGPRRATRRACPQPPMAARRCRAGRRRTRPSPAAASAHELQGTREECRVGLGDAHLLAHGHHARGRRPAPAARPSARLAGCR